MRHTLCNTQRIDRWVRGVCCVLLATGLMGCEALQRKFTRKSKHPASAPTPIIDFTDYTRTMTPLDRYRKHAMLFDYWNEQLLGALQETTLNPKRFKKASSESLAELETLHSLLSDETAGESSSLLEERKRLDRQLQSPGFTAFQAPAVWRALERQARQIHRELSWRDVEDKLKAPAP